MRPTQDIATCMYYTGIDPFTNKPVNTAHHLRDRKLQRALMQFFKPENCFEVREALTQAGRGDLIGGCEGLIPTNPPKEAIEAKRRQANEALRGDHYHTVANSANGEKPGEGGTAEQGLPAGAEDAETATGEEEGGRFTPRGHTGRVCLTW